MKYYFEFLISILAVIIILYKPKELVTLHDSLLGKFIMVLVVIILSLKSCLGGVLGAVMFMSLESQNDIIEGACNSKNCKESTIPLANGDGKMCTFKCTLQYKRYGAGKCTDDCGDCCCSLANGGEGCAAIREAEQAKRKKQEEYKKEQRRCLVQNMYSVVPKMQGGEAYPLKDDICSNLP